MVSRRLVLAGLAVSSAFLRVSQSQAAAGVVNAVDSGLLPNSTSDQTVKFKALLTSASTAGAQIFLPAGTYIVSGIQLPAYVNILGVSGQSRILYGGKDSFFTANDAKHVQLSGLTIDGNSKSLTDSARGLIEATNVGRFVIDDCQIVNARKNAIDLYQCGGRIENTRIATVQDMAIFTANSTALKITGNEISDCGNGGIIVHRYDKGRDGTVITGNRVDKIRADLGGTGENGNGINVFQANNVVVADNVVNGCAFTAIRANSANNIQIIANNCTASGETAIYSEFAFEGAVIANNIIDGAANGISIVNFDSGGRLATCSGNIVRNLSARGPYEGTFGIGIAAEADTAITSNVVEKAPTYGIQLGWGPYMRNLTASGNVIRTSGEGIYVSIVDGVGPAIISGNLIQGAKNGGIVGHKWADVAVKDLTLKGSAYSDLVVERNIVS